MVNSICYVNFDFLSKSYSKGEEVKNVLAHV